MDTELAEQKPCGKNDPSDHVVQTITSVIEEEQKRQIAHAKTVMEEFYRKADKHNDGVKLSKQFKLRPIIRETASGASIQWRHWKPRNVQGKVRVFSYNINKPRDQKKYDINKLRKFCRNDEELEMAMEAEREFEKVRTNLEYLGNLKRSCSIYKRYKCNLT
ncbi:hypothetical protein LRD18_11115 [Halorhodospira halochloris]|uniref:conjugative transfer protein MobI(A/C) n=1 Tax=Halorhodospira halochloris TaxID=1052 RepID=UPI001EE81921|nr:conjugative transfer protein MobI(A/C) [Halorhodospira halochloris]MCG5531398.1 hypothetical protein [Halorhodospira halochloris]